MNEMTELLPDLKLRFNIAHPNLEACYAYGYECALAEMDEQLNPYLVGSQEHEHWLEGWWAAAYGEEPLYALEEYAIHPEQVKSAEAANDQAYHHHMSGFITKLLEITGVIAVSAFMGYQVLDLVA